MAALDFGGVIRVNGKYVEARELFTEMEHTIGKKVKITDPNGTVKNYGFHVLEEGIHLSPYVWLGTEEFMIGLNRHSFSVVRNGIMEGIFGLDEDTYELPYEKKSGTYTFGDVTVEMRRLKWNHRRYYIRFVHKGVPYEGIFGYGVDPNYNRWYDFDHERERDFVARFMDLKK